MAICPGLKSVDAALPTHLCSLYVKMIRLVCLLVKQNGGKFAERICHPWEIRLVTVMFLYARIDRVLGVEISDWMFLHGFNWFIRKAL